MRTELFPDIFGSYIYYPNRTEPETIRTEPKIGRVLNGSSNPYPNYDTRNAQA